MFKRLGSFCACIILLLNLYGCVALLAGAAGGAGTAVWLSGKLTQTFEAPYEKTVRATKTALEFLKLNITKEVKEDQVTQYRGEYSDGKDFWVDVHRISDRATRVEVRVGALDSDKEAASQILNKIGE